jgi:hypothetical protein
MPTTRRTRIVRRAVMAVAGLVLLVTLLASGYVSTFCGLFYLEGRGLDPWHGGPVSLDAVFEPLDMYRHDGMPGGQTITDMSVWAYYRGKADSAARK